MSSRCFVIVVSRLRPSPNPLPPGRGLFVFTQFLSAMPTKTAYFLIAPPLGGPGGGGTAKPS